MLVEAVLFVTLLLLFLAVRDRKPPGMPPGPLEIPFLGNVPVVTTEGYVQLQKKYGDVVTTRLGGVRSVKIFDNKIAKEALAHADFVNRPSFFSIFSIDDKEKGGVVSSNGEQWQHERRFILKNLRNLGMGKTILETAIHVESEALVNDFKRHEGKPLKFPHSLRTVALNIIWQMVAGKRYELYSEEVSSIYDATNRFRKEFGFLNFIFMCFPFLNMIIPKKLRNVCFKTGAIDVWREEMRKLINKELDEQNLKFEQNMDEPVTLIYEYLKVMKEAENDEFSYKGSLMQIINDLFGAGSDTVANMLRWVVYLMAKYPDVTERLQKEIDEVVPKGQLVSLADKSRLPLVEAYVTEALRFSSMVYFNVQREAVRDTSVGGYFVPRGTQMVVANFYIHHDPKIWDKPKAFSPERFITLDGKFQAPKEGFFAFGSGRRQCLGETLARMELFLFTAALLQNFTIRAPEGQTIQDEVDDLMGIRAPRDQEFVYKFRG